MRRAVLILAACTLLAGCPKSGTLQGSGVEAPAPYGFSDYCARHPERAECGGTQ